MVLVLFPAGFVFSQQIRIMDETNLTPIENVMVFDKEQNYFLLTNNGGMVDIKTFQPGDTLFFRHPSYRLKEVAFTTLKNKKELFLQETNIKIQEVVIAANKWKQDKRDVPTKISIITPKEIAFHNPQTAADLLNISGEVYVQKSQQGGGSPMIRGFSTNRLLISVDGVRMNNAIFRSGNLQNVISIDPFAIEETEVLFGPGSVIYGSDAIGGVMSFYTLQPKFSDNDEPLIKGNAASRYSSANNELTNHFDINVGWEKWAMITSVSHNRYQNLTMGSNGPDEYLRDFYVIREDSMDIVVENKNKQEQVSSGYNQVNMMQKIRYSPTKNWELDYGFHYSTTSNYDRYDRLIRTKNRQPRSAEWYYGPQEWMMNSISATHTKKTAIYDEAVLRIANQLFKESRIDRDFNDNIRNYREEKVNALSTSLDFQKHIDSKQHLFYGLDMVSNFVESTGKAENIENGNMSGAPSRYPESDWSSYAVYLKYQYKISEQLNFTAGTRYNQFYINAIFDTTYYPFPFETAELNNDALTGSLGVVYKPIDSFWASVSGSTGFRSPNIDDMGKVFDSEPGAVVVPNPNLNAEYAYNAEVSLTGIIGKTVKANVTGFYTLLQNALVRRDYSLAGKDSILYDGELSKVQAIQNAATANVWGVQAAVHIKLPQGFGIQSTINYQKGEEEMDDGSVSPSRHAAPLFGATHLTFSAQKLKLDLNSVYNAERSFNELPVGEQGKPYLYAKDENGNPYSPAWATFNFRASYQLSKSLQFNAGIDNIMDIRYRPYSSGIAAAGRNFVFALRASF